MDGMPRPRPPHLHRERTRHGSFVWYVRREHGARIRLRAEYDSQEFWKEYRAAIEGVPSKAAHARLLSKPQTLGWGIDRYCASAAWAQLAPATRKQRANIYRAVKGTAGADRLSDIDQAAIIEGRDRRAATPHSANNFVKAMRGFYAWASSEEGKLVSSNPTKGVSLLKGDNDGIGFHTWTEDEVAQYEAKWPIGTRERLALDILLYTGFRRGDAVRCGRQHIRDTVSRNSDGSTCIAPFIHIRPEKRKRGKAAKLLVIPLLQPLALSIEATRVGDLTFLITERGLPFAKAGFGNWFRDKCDEAGLPDCSAHGLRKAGATRAANNGATIKQLMAMYGWETEKMAIGYTRAADDKRLANDAGQLLLPAHIQNEERPHLKSGKGASAKTSRKSGA
jgi:integrase